MARTVKPSEPVDDVVVPYGRFLECQDRRRHPFREPASMRRPPAPDDDALVIPISSDAGNPDLRK
jgi:hypothetical protein